MDLKIDDLKSFLEVQRQGTFTKAAGVLGLTQPALSQKIARLEETLQATIFVRLPRSLLLTGAGERLLVYAKEVLRHQEDFLAGFDQYQAELSGVIRVAGYSSVMRSMIIPRIAEVSLENPKVSIEYQTCEMFELEGILKSNQADFIVTDYHPGLVQSEEVEIDVEEYVIIESRLHKNIPNVFLDHTPQDNATSTYFKHLGLKGDYRREYMGDVYSIIDGVALGLGRAVMSKHLIDNDKRFKVLNHKKKYKRSVVLTYLKQSYYGPLHELVARSFKLKS